MNGPCFWSVQLLVLHGEGDGLVQLDMYDPRGVFRLQISLTLQLIKSNNGGVLGRSDRPDGGVPNENRTGSSPY